MPPARSPATIDEPAFHGTSVYLRQVTRTVMRASISRRDVCWLGRHHESCHRHRDGSLIRLQPMGLEGAIATSTGSPFAVPSRASEPSFDGSGENDMAAGPAGFLFS